MRKMHKDKFEKEKKYHVNDPIIIRSDATDNLSSIVI